MSNPNSEQLQSVAGSVADEYDRDHNAEVLADYEALFSVLRELHDLHPKWRFGQMIGNLAARSGTTKPGEIYDVPDERLLKMAREHLAKRRAQLKTATAKS